jgi:hypothetical protein
MGSSPQVVDWDSDGDADLISGDRNGYFNVWIWDDTGLVAYTQYKKTDSTPMNVGANSQPTVIDWNGDGKKDLFLGCQNGQVFFWPNQTSDAWPMFQSAETVEAGSGPIYQYRINPIVFDLDCDGVNDLVCGEDGGYVLFYRNTGTNSSPSLAAAETLKSPRGEPVRASGTYVYGSRCWFGFWDADSVPDILLSAYDGYVELFHGLWPVGVEEGRPAPARLALSAGPNPTNGSSVTIRYTFDAQCQTQLQVHDLTGRVVRTLGTSSPSPGEYSVVWDGRDDSGAEVNSGVYFCRLSGSGETAAARVVVSR